jgi:hypothetical protein
MKLKEKDGGIINITLVNINDTKGSQGCQDDVGQSMWVLYQKKHPHYLQAIGKKSHQ